MLSATPFKPYTNEFDHLNGEHHHKEFENVLRFLLTGESEIFWGDFESNRKAFFNQLRHISTLKDDFDSAIQTKKNLEKIYINIIGDKNDLKKIKSTLNDKRIECLLTQNEYEFPTLEKIIDVSNKDEFYGIYIHTKASSYPKEYKYKHILNFWRKFMNHLIFSLLI
jgi:hypothetical protein